MRKEIFIHAVGTAVPQYSKVQSEMLEMVLKALPDDDHLHSLVKRLYRHSGIETRYSVVPDFHDSSEAPPFIPGEALSEDGPSTAHRNSLFSKEAPVIAEKAARELLAQLPNLDPGKITHLVSTSCTGFSAPGFDMKLARQLHLQSQVERFHIGFMGCFAAFPALRLAHSICSSQPDARVLIVSSELCSLHYRHRFDSDSLVSNSLFADGAAAALVSAQSSDGNGNGFALHAFASRILDDSGNDMTWVIGDHGFEMTLSQSVPRVIEQNIAGILKDTAQKAGIPSGTVKNWALHPGGRAILDRALKALGLGANDFNASYSVLRDYGNMSSSTIFFVLKQLLKEKAAGLLFSAAFGPGLTAEAGIMEAY